MKKIIVGLTFSLMLIATLMSACSISRSDTNPSFRTDVKPVKDRFPELEKIEKVLWQSDMIGSKRFGPTSYWMKGYIYISEEVMDQYRDSYHWTEATDWRPSLNVIASGETTYHWAYSEQFNDQIRPSNFIGEFYVDFDNRVIYFEVER